MFTGGGQGKVILSIGKSLCQDPEVFNNLESSAALSMKM